MTIRLTELNSEPEWDPDRASVNRSRASTIVRYCQNTIDYSSCSLTSRVRSCKLIASRARNFLFLFRVCSLAFDVRPCVFDAHLSATQAVSLCLYQSSGRGQPERMLRGQELRRSVSSVERRSCRAWTRQARGARLHIELSRSMRHRRDGFSRTGSFFLWPRHGRGRPRDCGCPRYASTC